MVAALVAGGAASAAIVATGSTSTFPAGPPIGPGDTDLGNIGLFVGNGGLGTLDADGGSFLRTGALYVGPSGSGNGDGSVLFTGAGTRVELIGDGFSDGVINRLGVGEWGRGSLTVSAGAVLDGRADAAACLGVNHYCNNFIGNAAGSDATFTVTGAGSQASFLRFFGVGGVAVFAPPIDGFSFGTPGASTTGRVNVLDGATLVTDSANIGLGPGGGSPTGRERSFADVVVSGPGSLWRVTTGTIDPQPAGFFTATHRNAWATVAVTEGGTLRIEGNGSQYSMLHLTTGGGRTDAVVSGADSRVNFSAQSGIVQVGRSLGSATLDVRDGGLVDGMFYASVGRDGSFGTLTVDGAGSLFRVDGTATAAANGVTGAAVMDIGRGGGTGVVNVTGGARLELVATTGTVNGIGLSVGRDAASSGTLNIGSGGVVQIRAESVSPGTAAETWNPWVRVGRDGSGSLGVTGGGQLLLQGNAVSTTAHTRGTSLYIGGSGSTSIGGKGTATVSGAGSAIRVTGSDAYIGVGHGPQAVGSLNVTAGGAVESTILAFGNFGGTGIGRLDNASVSLSGQFSGGAQSGAALVIGAGAGAVGNLSASNGSTILISNAGGSSRGVAIGGSRSLEGGDGSLTLSASSLVFDVPANDGGLTVGRTGSGILRLQNGSTVDLGGNVLTVGAVAGADGTLIATGGSTITAGWVGVGRRIDLGTGDTFDGGTGTMVLNGATLFASDVVIGTNGFLGGSAGSIVVSGTITNYGIFSPGSSPGTFSIDGDYVAGAGSRMLLEVEADGVGGFRTDEVLFTQGRSIDLSALAVEFRFLGATDPNAFQASGGFDIDSFLALRASGGGLVALEDAAFDGVVFSASAEQFVISDFSYAAETGASFVATPVPEPAPWLMFAGGLAWLAMRRRRAANP